MKIEECVNLFVVEYKLECQKNRLKELEFQNKVLAAWISAAQQDIATRLKILTAYVDVAYAATTTYTKYDLPSNWGGLFRSEPDMRVVDISEIQSYVTTGNSLTVGSPQAIAVYNDSTGYHAVLAPLPTAAGTIRLWYSIDPGLYSPSAVAAQDWGTFDGTTFTGSLKIPDKYFNLIILYMLGKISVNKQMEYEATLSRMRSNSSSTRKEGLEYQPIGGYSIE